MSISIHSLLAEGDDGRRVRAAAPPEFQSTPSSRRETDFAIAMTRVWTFQSTPSSRRETSSARPGCRSRRFQSTPSSRRETFCASGSASAYPISIHSLLAEGDVRLQGFRPVGADFNPLPPRGGRPFPSRLSLVRTHFNPLPPRGGRRMRPAAPSFGQYFNPLPPRGGRHDKIVYVTAGGRFQSTPSSRRETLARSADRAEREISIHSLLAEGDVVGL